MFLIVIKKLGTHKIKTIIMGNSNFNFKSNILEKPASWTLIYSFTQFISTSQETV